MYELEISPEVKYKGLYEWLAYNLEKCPETNRMHYQVYIYFKKRTKFSEVKFYDSQAHWEIRMGSHSEAKAYVTKEETRVEGPYQYGSDANIAETQGARSDLLTIKNKLEQGVKVDQIAEEHFASYCRYYKAFDRFYRYHRTLEIDDELKAKFSQNFVLRGWQFNCLEEILLQDDRKIKWVVDVKGNTGKSTFSDYLVSQHDGYLVTGGAHKDIAYDYQMQKLVILDLPRAYVDHKDIYKLIEDFKNGRVFSTKYESCSKRAVGVKVVVFTNWEPDQDMLSMDRWNITRLQTIDQYNDQIRSNNDQIHSNYPILNEQEIITFPIDLATLLSDE